MGLVRSLCCLLALCVIFYSHGSDAYLAFVPSSTHGVGCLCFGLDDTLWDCASSQQVFAALAVPLELPHRNVFVSYNFEANYNSPYNWSLPTLFVSPTVSTHLKGQLASSRATTMLSYRIVYCSLSKMVPSNPRRWSYHARQQSCSTQTMTQGSRSRSRMWRAAAQRNNKQLSCPSARGAPCSHAAIFIIY